MQIWLKAYINQTTRNALFCLLLKNVRHSTLKNGVEKKAPGPNGFANPFV